MKHGATISIDEMLINQELKDKIMTAAQGMVESYKVTLIGESIILDAVAAVPKLGRLNLKYMMKITEFSFNAQKRYLELYYLEDVKSCENMLGAAALNLAKKKGTLLMLAAGMLKGVDLDADKCTVRINLQQFPQVQRIPKEYRFTYVSCDAGALKLGFDIS